MRAHGGYKTYKKVVPSIIEYNGVKLKEFPINTFNFFGQPIIFSGGGYFRVLPYSLIKKMTSSSEYIMTYCHPRDFDFNQPLVPGLSTFRRFKSYVGIKNCKLKLKKWLNDYKFIDLSSANKLINWQEAHIVKL